MNGGLAPAGSDGPGRTPGEREKLAVAHLNALAARFFQGRLPRSWVPGYLEARGFSQEVQACWGAGYAPARRDGLTRALRAQGCPDVLIEKAGLARRIRSGDLIDVFRDRVMLPVRSPSGMVVGFIGRAVGAASYMPRYLNSPRTCLYDKSAMLFGLCEARPLLTHGARPVLVEGPLDAIAVTADCGGRFAGLAACGTALTAQHVSALAQLVDLRCRGVLVAFDADPAGLRAAVRAYHLLWRLTEQIDIVDLPAGKDPAQILTEAGSAALTATLIRQAHPLADVLVDLEVGRWERWLQFAEGQVHALRAGAGLIAALPPSQVARQVVRLAARLNLDHAVVTEAVTGQLPHVLARPPDHG
jgi:DNA primase